MRSTEIERLAAEALSGFDTEKHYVVKAVYADGFQLKSVKYFAENFESLDYLIDSLIDDDMVDLEVTATSLGMDDFATIGVHLKTIYTDAD